MSNSSEPVPQRIGDAERDQAADFLREHHAQGRLDAAEFDERVTVALTAKWQSDLDRLFVDLPAPTSRSVRSATPPTPPATARSAPIPPATQLTSNGLAIAAALIWPVTIALVVLTHGEMAFLIFVAIFLTGAWHRRRGFESSMRSRRESERRRLEAERRRLEAERSKWDRPPN